MYIRYSYRLYNSYSYRLYDSYSYRLYDSYSYRLYDSYSYRLYDGYSYRLYDRPLCAIIVMDIIEVREHVILLRLNFIIHFQSMLCRPIIVKYKII